MPALEIAQLRKQFGPTVALDGVDVQLERGRVHALVGENGAGKSTLVKVLAGELRPDAGEVRREGRPYAPGSPLEARRHGVALIHQEPTLCPHLTVAENLVLGRETARWGWLNLEAQKEQAEQALRLFDHPELRPGRRLGELSISARQIVDICRVLAEPSEIVLMDEPTSALQRSDVERLFELIRALVESGRSVLYISHFLEEVREVADTVTVLRDGRDVLSGPLEEIDDRRLITAMVGRPVENLYPPRPPVTRRAEALLEVEGLAHPPWVESAAFRIFRGEVFGIAGLAGSGRTALVRALFGLEKPRGGRLRLSGRSQDLSRPRPADRIAAGLGYLSEDRAGEGLAVALSIADNLTLTRPSSCSRAGWLDLRRQREQAAGWVRRLGIKAASVLQPVRTLSGGTQQKVALGRLLHQEAEVLLLDEPTRGVDIGSKVQIYRVIADLVAKGKSVLLVSSYLPELFGMCDRLAVMGRGRLSRARPVSEWTPESVLAAALGQVSP